MKRNLIALLSLALGATAVCADDAERHGSKMMNAKAVSSGREVTGGLRVLFLGNSITLHAALPEIGWTNVWGMAASAAEKDYVHLVTRGIEMKTGRKTDVQMTARGLFWHDGVQAHPGDRGMQEIADRILGAFFP